MAEIDAEQLRAARELLRWTVRVLSIKSLVRRTLIEQAEREGSGFLSLADRTALRRALEHAGVEFMNEGKVRLA